MANESSATSNPENGTPKTVPEPARAPAATALGDRAVDLGGDGVDDTSAQSQDFAVQVRKDLAELARIRQGTVAGLEGKKGVHGQLLSQAEYDEYCERARRVLETHAESLQDLREKYAKERETILKDAKALARQAANEETLAQRMTESSKTLFGLRDDRAKTEGSVRARIARQNALPDRSKHLILGYQSKDGVGNYAIRVEAFEAQLRLYDIRRINSVALGEYLMYCWDQAANDPKAYRKHISDLIGTNGGAKVLSMLWAQNQDTLAQRHIRERRPEIADETLAQTRLAVGDAVRENWAGSEGRNISQALRGSLEKSENGVERAKLAAFENALASFDAHDEGDPDGKKYLAALDAALPENIRAEPDVAKKAEMIKGLIDATVARARAKTADAAKGLAAKGLDPRTATVGDLRARGYDVPGQGEGTLLANLGDGAADVLVKMPGAPGAAPQAAEMADMVRGISAKKITAVQAVADNARLVADQVATKAGEKETVNVLKKSWEFHACTGEICRLLEPAEIAALRKNGFTDQELSGTDAAANERVTAAIRGLAESKEISLREGLAAKLEQAQRLKEEVKTAQTVARTVLDAALPAEEVVRRSREEREAAATAAAPERTAEVRLAQLAPGTGAELRNARVLDDGTVLAATPAGYLVSVDERGVTAYSDHGAGEVRFDPEKTDARAMDATMSLFCATGLGYLEPQKMDALTAAWNARHPARRLDLSDGLFAGTSATDGEAAKVLTFAECVFFGEPHEDELPEARTRRLRTIKDGASVQAALRNRGLLEPDGSLKGREILLAKLSEPLELARATDDVDAMMA